MALFLGLGATPFITIIDDYFMTISIVRKEKGHEGFYPGSCTRVCALRHSLSSWQKLASIPHRG
jgi:hypothetical protein